VGEDLQGRSFEARDPTGLGLGLERLQSRRSSLTLCTEFSFLLEAGFDGWVLWRRNL
jgi:hypothetical protein